MNPDIIREFAPVLKAELDWWMDPKNDRIVTMDDGSNMFRYLGTEKMQPESFQEDIKVYLAAIERGMDPDEAIQGIITMTESGKDMTERWIAEQGALETARAHRFITPELNSMLYLLMRTVGLAHELANNPQAAKECYTNAAKLAESVNKYLYRQDIGYGDYDIDAEQLSPIMSIGTAHPVAYGLAPKERQLRVAEIIRGNLLKKWGIVSADIPGSRQQWDNNGWAPDKFHAVAALVMAGDYETAMHATFVGLRRDNDVYNLWGHLPEKTDVTSELALPGEGGEYPGQWDFLWKLADYILSRHLYATSNHFLGKPSYKKVIQDLVLRASGFEAAPQSL